jgi:hypothetical protein
MGQKIALIVSLSFILGIGISVDSFSSEPMAKYVGTDTCKMCHWKQYRSWAKTKMAKTFETSLDAEQREDPGCIDCHSTGYKKPGGFVNSKTTPKMAGVQCEACHGAGSCHNEKNPFSPGPFKFDKNKGVHEHFPMSKWFKKHQYDR